LTETFLRVAAVLFVFGWSVFFLSEQFAEMRVKSRARRVEAIAREGER
jgi:hypothetical protein